MLLTRKHHCFLALRNMINVSNDERSVLPSSGKHDQCFEWRKIIVFLQQETWSVFRMTKNHCFPPARNMISVSNDKKTLFCENDSPGNSDQFGTGITSVRFNAAELWSNMLFSKKTFKNHIICNIIYIFLLYIQLIVGIEKTGLWALGAVS